MMTAVLALQVGLLSACGKDPQKAEDQARAAEIERARLKRQQQACASAATYDRLKQIAFEQAIGVNNPDPKNLDLLASYAHVRMENPVVKSRDDKLDITVCSGKLILDLPPGAERGFGGARRLEADVEYEAQAAADSSGLVYRLKGAEPIVNQLAAFDLKGQAYRPAAGPAVAQQTTSPQIGDPEPQIASAPEPAPAAPPVRRSPEPEVVQQAPAPPPPPPPPRRAAAETGARVRTSPSFDCRYGRSRSEQMVCSNSQLAALDRTMSSRFYSALSGADRGTRAALRRSRDRFLAYRERCGDEACVAQAYRDRMDEIADIAAQQ